MRPGIIIYMAGQKIEQVSEACIWSDADCEVDEEYFKQDCILHVNTTNQLKNKLVTDKGRVHSLDISPFGEDDEIEILTKEMAFEIKLDMLARTHNLEKASNNCVSHLEVDNEAADMMRSSSVRNLTTEQKKQIWKTWKNMPSVKILEQILH
uniref:Uncharacterized protein n=1 Tax=Euplotes harpa TaxID=151035 RepID=A0A7S3JDP0_9SPIT|mmetsp:Transcript_31961/g.36479  ORF Transcript_31961/g.36479 Transcript_31961/m.36479 type:complete len:152 (+) Transcript_31961:18-473(+)